MKSSFMRKVLQVSLAICFCAGALWGQTKHVWILRPSGEMVEYDPATFAVKQTVKVPATALKSSAVISVNRTGQILYAPALSLPLSDEDAKAAHSAWLWNGHAGSDMALEVERKVEETGSNQAVTENAPNVFLSADGQHLFWFSNEARRLQREEVDLSTDITWKAWVTDLAGSGRTDLGSTKLPDCRCSTGTCEETCPSGVVWAPEGGIDNFFLMNQFAAGQTNPIYKASTVYQQQGGKWTGTNLPEALQRVLDASADASTIVEAIPDTGCCGWSNQSNDQTLVLANAKKIVIFDEQATYKNPDYDVSFYSANARLSPDASQVAMTITATAQANKPIQLSEQGQANPEESQRIRKALGELPAVVVKTIADVPEQVGLIPHTTLVGWLNENELLIVEDHLLAVYNVTKKTTRKSAVRVEDATRVFLP